MAPVVLLLSQPVHPIPPVKGAAVEQWIDEVAHRLKGYSPLVVGPVHPERADQERVDGVDYARIRIGRVYRRLFQKLTRWDPWPYISRVAAVAKARQVALIHLHNAPQFVAPLKRALPGVPLILHMHNDLALRGDLAPDVLAACSDYVLDLYRARLDPGVQFSRLPNGVAPERFAQQDVAAREQARAGLGVSPEKFVVLFAGRISAEKGPDLLLEAAAQLNPDRFSVLFAGEIRDHGRSERDVFGRQFRERAAALPHVTLLGGVSHAAMPGIYAAADLLVIPSRFEEPFSMVAIEAMASGLPVLAFRRGGMVEYMQDQVNALLVPPLEAPALAVAVEQAAASPERLQGMAQAARQMVAATYSWAEVAEETAGLYRTVLAARGA